MGCSNTVVPCGWNGSSYNLCRAGGSKSPPEKGMEAYGGGLPGFFIASPMFSSMKLSKVYLLRCSVSEFSLDMLRGRIDRRGDIVDLEVITACDISLPSFLMGLRIRPRHSFAVGNEFGVIYYTHW